MKGWREWCKHLHCCRNVVVEARPATGQKMPQTTPAGCDDSATAFSFPAVRGKKVTAAFDGGRLTSDGGVLLLAQAERMMGICQQLAACIADPRDPARVVHRLEDIFLARVLAILPEFGLRVFQDPSGLDLRAALADSSPA